MICHMLSERFMPMFRWCSAVWCACTTSACVFFFCEFVCPGCESGFYPTLPGCHSWSQQVYLVVCTRAQWADGQIESALVLWIWNLGLGRNLSTIHCVLLLISGFSAILDSSGFCLLFGFVPAIWWINLLTFIFYFIFIWKPLVWFILMYIIRDPSNMYGRPHAQDSWV